jgi:hypothetical protein
MVPLDAAIPLTSPFCKVTDISEVDSERSHSTLQPLKQSHTIGSDISNVSSHPSPDVEEVEEAIIALSSPVGQPELKLENPETFVELPAKSPCSEQARRRSSHPWKGFSLKKRLSRVDQKLKHTFSAASQHTDAPYSTSQSKEKRSSVFYYSSSDMPCTPSIVHPTETESPTEPPEGSKSKDICTPDCSQTEPHSDFTVCGATGSDANTQEQECTGGIPSQEYTCSQVLLSPTEDSRNDNTDDTSDIEPTTPMQDETEEFGESVITKKFNRPVDLPLFDTDGKPVRPPRRELKKKCVEKRDGRLLSVPNIKFNRADHCLRDLRNKEDSSSNQPSFGNLMRRLSKCA